MRPALNCEIEDWEGQQRCRITILSPYGELGDRDLETAAGHVDSERVIQHQVNWRAIVDSVLYDQMRRSCANLRMLHEVKKRLRLGQEMDIL